MMLQPRGDATRRGGVGWGSMDVEVSGPEAGAFIIISVVVFPCSSTLDGLSS